MRQSRTITLRDAIEQDIVTGRFGPGERLDEVKLAKRFKVSRTPIREALQQLRASGLVEVQTYRGAFVAENSATDLIEMFEVMAELEGMCARLAARRGLPERLTWLLETHRRCLATLDESNPDPYYYANEQFHHAIYDASGNRFLADQAKALHTRLKPYRRLQLRVPGRMRSSLAEHEQIVRAICAHDVEASEALLKAHIVIQGERFGDFFAALSAERDRRDSEGTDASGAPADAAPRRQADRVRTPA
jgi:DNA-binding GntR family transcriptional regulator